MTFWRHILHLTSNDRVVQAWRALPDEAGTNSPRRGECETNITKAHAQLRRDDTIRREYRPVLFVPGALSLHSSTSSCSSSSSVRKRREWSPRLRGSVAESSERRHRPAGLLTGITRTAQHGPGVDPASSETPFCFVLFRSFASLFRWQRCVVVGRTCRRCWRPCCQSWCVSVQSWRQVG